MTDYFLAGLLENRPNREAEQTDRARYRTARFAIRKALDDTDRQLLLDILGVTWQDASPGPLRDPHDLPSGERGKKCAKCGISSRSPSSTATLTTAAVSTPTASHAAAPQALNGGSPARNPHRPRKRAPSAGG
jgi:hypothetical protein